MPKVLTEVDNFDANVTVPIGGDGRNASSVETGFQNLTNRTKNLNGRLTTAEADVARLETIQTGPDSDTTIDPANGVFVDVTSLTADRTYTLAAGAATGSWVVINNRDNDFQINVTGENPVGPNMTGIYYKRASQWDTILLATNDANSGRWFQGTMSGGSLGNGIQLTITKDAQNPASAGTWTVSSNTIKVPHPGTYLVNAHAKLVLSSLQGGMRLVGNGALGGSLTTTGLCDGPAAGSNHSLTAIVTISDPATETLEVQAHTTGGATLTASDAKITITELH